MSDTSSAPTAVPAPLAQVAPSAPPEPVKSAGKVILADAASILHCYESEVLDVSSADEGTVATTKDGQRYLLTADGGYVWLQVPKIVPQLLAGE
jgi:hypothetical protein